MMALRVSVHCRHPLHVLRAAQEMGITMPHCGNHLCSTCVGKHKPVWTSPRLPTIVQTTDGERMTLAAYVTRQRRRNGNG